MEVLLALALRLSDQYKLAAFALALLMFLFYRMVTNSKLIRLADTVLNRSLTRTNLYKFLKLAIVLVCVFSTVVVVLSLLSPVLMNITENKKLQIIMDVETAMKNRDYAQVTTMGRQSLLMMAPDDPSAERMRGLIAAGYYEEKQFEEGLEFICNEYRHKARDDVSFLFSIHAFVRAIAVKSGPAYGEQVASRLRAKCQRADFSPYWAHIRFGLMESLRTGVGRTDHGWSQEEADQKRLRQLLTDDQVRLGRLDVPFADYALYFLGDFDVIIDKMRASHLRDIALYDAARFAQGLKRIEYFEKLIADYPDTHKYAVALRALAIEYGALDEGQKAIFYASKLKDARAVENTYESAFNRQRKALSQFIRAGDFAAAAGVAKRVCGFFRDKGLTCIPDFELEEQKIARARAIVVAAEHEPIKRCRQTQFQLKPLAVLEEKRVDNKWIAANRSILEKCAEPLTSEPDDYARSLYLLASLSRQIGDYKSSLQYLVKFVKEVRDHDLLDDVVTEIGYHRLFIENNWDAAKAAFEAVQTHFPGRNSVDNAWWWYAQGMKMQGQYFEALRAYAIITASELQTRFKKITQNETQQLQKFTALPPFAGIALQRDPEEGGLRVHTVAGDAPSRELLRRGDRLMQACGEKIYVLDDVLKKIDGMEHHEVCSIMFLRGDTLIQFTGTMASAWNSIVTKLSRDELIRLIYGMGDFELKR